jgi:putative oxidoreductase
MKTKIQLSLQVLLGIAFVVFGLNKFIGFMPAPDLSLAAMAFMAALSESGYMMQLVGLTEVVAGALILSRVFTPLGLVLLAPVSVNIVLFHLFLDPASGIPAYVLAALNLYLLLAHLPKYRPLLSMN